MSHITLVIPGLLPLPSGITEADFNDRRSLHRLLARADHRALPGSADAWLTSQFGYSSPAPWAALSYLADTGEARSDLLRADPVHLAAGREGVVLFDATLLGIEPDEAAGLADTVRPLLDEHGIELAVRHPARWYLLCGTAPRIRTCPLMDAVGRDVSDKLPAGEEQVRWRQLFTEIQMLLHEAPVNRDRERRGQLPVNSLWLWGEGEIAGAVRPGADRPFDLCLADDPASRGLARRFDLPVHDLPESAAALFELPIAPPRLLVVMDAVRHAAAYQDPAAWLDFSQALDKRWIRPLQQALWRGRIRACDLVSDRHAYTWRRWHDLRFWRRPPLPALQRK